MHVTVGLAARIRERGPEYLAHLLGLFFASQGEELACCVASVSTLRDGISRMVSNGEGNRHLVERGDIRMQSFTGL
jgi:hypothetical protein